MKRLTATEAARQFSSLLDDVENKGETFVVVRHGRAIARVEPAASKSGRTAKELLRRAPVDRDWRDDVERTRSLIGVEPRPWRD